MSVIGEMTVCAAPSCKEVFRKKTTNHLYHAKQCKREVERIKERQDLLADITTAIAKRKEDAPKEESILPSPDVTIDFLRKEVQRLGREVDKYKSLQHERNFAMQTALSEGLKQFKLDSIKPPQIDQSAFDSELVAVIGISDVQLSKTTPSYNTDIAEARMYEYIEHCIQIVQIHREGRPINVCHVWCLGDIIEGAGIFPGQCVDEQTEALTPTGWKRIDELVITGEPIAIYDSNLDTIIWDTPSSFNITEYEGPMIHHQNTQVDSFVTPNHDMWVRNKSKLGYSKRKASEVISRDWRLKVAINGWKGTGYTAPKVPASSKCPGWAWDCDPKDLAAFIGWFLSEGSAKYGETAIWQSKEKNPQNWEEIRSLLSRITTQIPVQEGRPYNHAQFTSTEDGHFIYNVPLASWLKNTFKTNSKDAAVPKWIKNWDKPLLQNLFNALIAGDGTTYSPTSWSFYSTSDQMIDDVQEIALKLGYGAIAKERVYGYGKIREWEGEYSCRKLYITNIVNGDRCVGKQLIKDYSGRVWCPTVKTGLWLMRRNGKICVTGNSYLVDAGFYRQVTIHGPRIFANCLRRLLENFEYVEVHCVIGNHGRLGSRHRDEFDPETNGDRMLYRILDHIFANESRISFVIPDGPGERNWYDVDEIGNYSSLLCHGDQFQSINSLYTVGRKVMSWKEAIPEDWDDIAIGHFHQSMRFTFGKTIMRVFPSSESDNTYAIERLASSGTPMQHLMFVDPARGVVDCEYDVVLT